MRVFLLALLFTILPVSTLFCQPVSIGVKAGVPLGDAYQNPPYGKTNNKYWTVGPTIEVRLPARLALGFDAMYQPYEYRWLRNVGNVVFSQHGEVSRWEMPLYLKYRFAALDNRIQPFVAAGAVLGVARTNNYYDCVGGPELCGIPTSSQSKVTEWGSGVVAGGGVEFRKFGLKFAPEVRYTHWGSGLLAPKSPDQVSLLLGIRF